MRVLVIVSAHYGELSLARYFLNGLGLSPVPVVMVPASLRQPEGVEADVDVRAYEDLDDIVRVVEETQPEVALLFSGYLLTIGRRFSLLQAFRLMRLLRRRGVRILTSDPFIGLVSDPWSLRFEKMFAPRRRGGRDHVAAMLSPLFAIRTYLLHLELRRHAHLYAAPVAHPFPVAGHRGLAFYNAAAERVATHQSAVPDPQPVWLFVLSEVDFRYQTNRLGGAFVTHVAARLRDAARPGRRVVMVAPGELVADLRGRIANGAGIELRENPPHAEYMAAILHAERLFLWNYFSFSVLHRVLVGGPVFYFDEGHMVDILPALGQAGIDTYYAGWRPPLLRVDEPLDEAALERLAQLTRERFAAIKARMAQGHSPRELLARFARAEGRPGAG